jgi:hypothetical protein
VKLVEQIGRLSGIALLCMGSAMPVGAWAHSEGVEAADPATPTALLTLDSAASGYTPPSRAPLDWRILFEDQGGSSPAEHGAHSGHAGAAHHTPATMQQ